MSYQEKRSVVSLVSNVLIFTVYYSYVLRLYHAQSMDMDTEHFFKFWGAAILILIPVLVFAKLLIHTMFTAINASVTHEAEPRFADELDKRINRQATVNFCRVFMGGYVLAMGGLIIGWSPYIMFNILLFSAIIAGIFIDITQLYLYRKGISN